MPKIVDKDKMKLEISDKALTVFIDKGYYHTRIEDISKLCHMSRTSIYQYFTNKDEIFIYTLNRKLDEIRDDYFPLLEDKSLSNIEKIKKIIFLVFKEYAEKKELMDLVAVFWLKVKLERIDLLEGLRERTEKLQLIFEELLENGVRNKELKEINTKSMAKILFLIVRGFIVQTSFYDDVSLNNLQESTEKLIDGLILK